MQQLREASRGVQPATDQVDQSPSDHCTAATQCFAGKCPGEFFAESGYPFTVNNPPSATAGAI